MNNPNLKKRRPYGHEDAPAVPVPQVPWLPESAAVSRAESYSPEELHILQQASSILKCSINQLFILNSNPPLHPLTLPHPLPHPHPHPHPHHPAPHHPALHHQAPPHPAPYAISSKRQRLNRDVSPMSSPEKPSPSGQAAPTHQQQHHRSEAVNSPLSLGTEGSRLIQYFANFSVCSPCTTCEPQGYSGVPATAAYSYVQNQSFFDHKSPPHAVPGSLPPTQPNVYACDESVVAQPMMPNYAVMQPSRPMSIQPTTSREGMVYPETVPSQQYLSRPEMQHESPTSASNHVMAPHPYNSSPPMENTKDPRRRYDIVQSNQRPPPARRGPFRSNDDREKTAETRRIGSCIRCRMQRIRCETNPIDKHGACLTCQRVSNVKVWRMPCLRYKITDVKLFKPGQVKGHEWTRRWVEGIADDISQWASAETKCVKVTEGYTDQPVELRVRQFIPQEGDALERTWVYDGIRRRVSIPAYAIVNLEEAKGAYSNYIHRGFFECCKNVLSGKEKLLMATYIAAIKAARDPAIDEKERELLKKALQLWMAIRLTTKSTIIVGEETLGMSRDIMDETSPLKGCIPLPPVMGAQIELVLIHQIQSGLRREMLENLQAMTQANKHQTWFTTYLITFILLHNVALLCQHDAGYARKHGIKNRFAREDMVREYQMGANILLAYFHYCNKGIYPFSAECKEQDLKTLAELDEAKTHFIKLTRSNVENHKKHWAKIRESNDYENDFYYISQLFEENWLPQPTI
ncbi:hypothetical protein F4810DRAFT_453549 [Camillea tinctor]|nr:hypothetical protein F4810DRAFT_453549 [Camillea tinctor]